MKSNTKLWIVQGILAAVFLLTGVMKLVLPLDVMAGPVALPGPFLRFIGVAEVCGAIGLILPGMFGIQPSLTPIAAAGLVIIMAGAVVVTVIGGSIPAAIIPAIVGVLAASVVVGRWPSSSACIS